MSVNGNQGAFIRNLRQQYRHARKLSRQFYYMYSKSLILQLRYWPSTVTQVLVVPFGVVLLVYILQVAITNLITPELLSPPITELKAAPTCASQIGSQAPCINLFYTPKGDPTYDNIMQKFVLLNNKRHGTQKFRIDDAWTPTLDSLPPTSLSVVGVPDRDFIYNFVSKYPNITGWGISFSQATSSRVISGNLETVTDIQYELWYNVTDSARKFRPQGAPPFVITYVEPHNDDVVAMYRAIDEAILAYAHNDEDLRLNYSLKGYPDLGTSAAARCPTNPDDIFRQLLPFLYIPATVIFFSLLNSIVNEKEKNLKDAMKTIGLEDIVFWTSHYFSGAIVMALASLLIVAFGKAFAFNFFAKADFGVLFLLFTLFGWALLAFGLFVASVTSKVKTAIGLGFFIIIAGGIYLGAGRFVTYIWYTDPNDPDTLDLSAGWKVLMFFPFFNFNKLLFDIYSYTGSKTERNGTECILVEGTKFKWEDLYKKFNATGDFGTTDASLNPVPNQSLEFMVMNIFLWFILAWYLDKVLPNENGLSEHPLFFIFPSYYGFKDPEWMMPSARNYIPDQSKPLSSEDADVTEERQNVRQTSPNDDEVGLRLLNFHKMYYSGLKAFFSWTSKIVGGNGSFAEKIPNSLGLSKVAVHELSLSVKKGQMLALLGSNGAGKTSTMKVLYGVSPLSTGEARIFGMDVRSNMKEIRRTLGVCPQFDLLFPDLTAQEHIQLFCGIKGIPHNEILEITEQRLKHMKLYNVRDQRAGQYSGGMKRRLSVILSTLGDPKCVFMDEPTTGMDPVNKRYVWSFLEEFKKDRIIVLTTHSMEEADILADKIAIMAKGRLKAVGKSIRLKNKFGNGYHISMVIPRAIDTPSVKKEVEAACPSATLVEEEYIGAEAPPKKDNVEADDVAKSPEDGPEQPGGSSSRLVYEVSSVQDAKSLIEYLEKATKSKQESATNPIASFGMSQTTLEDVFLKMVKEAK